MYMKVYISQEIPIIFLGILVLLNLDFVLVKGKEIDIHVSSEDFFASYMPFI